MHAVSEGTTAIMIDLATYTPMGDKKNSDFFEEYLPRVYERRQASGLDQIVGNTAALVVQVEHGDGVDYMAELAAMGPYRFQAARLTDTHKVYVLQSQPEFPRLIVLEPLIRDLRGQRHPVEHALPAGQEEAERALHRRGLQGRVHQGGPGGAGAAEHPLRLPGRHGERLLHDEPPDLHVHVRLHLQPGRLRRRRHRRPRRPRARRGDHPDRRGAGQARPRRRAAGASTASRASCSASTTRRPGSWPATGSTRCWSTSRWCRTTSGAPTTSTR